MLAGEKYGRLTAVEFVGRTKQQDQLWSFLCDCGTVCTKRSWNVKNGLTKSCGCLRKENKGAKVTHGHTIGKFTGKSNWSLTYQSWVSMKQRCTNPSYESYSKYGGSGITYCSDWESFDSFLNDMGERKSKEYSLDRIDNSKGYSKENCRWATRKEQARNRTTNVHIEFGGEDRLLCEVVEETGRKNIRNRLRKGWSLDDSLNIGKNKERPLEIASMRKNEKNYKDEKKKIMELFKRSTKIVSTYLSVLDSRERQIIEMRFGLKTGKRMTLQEIGEVENCTRERIRQIEAKAMEKMLRFYSELAY